MIFRDKYAKNKSNNHPISKMKNMLEFLVKVNIKQIQKMIKIVVNESSKLSINS
ncbi:hypothetical protein RCA_00065 [Rickettsia canadensis str. CA410]|uniref:Uncharacterized protein n=1 Tax=Rickettsia canadensis str. CA410 TaxID=1105107 RepID=A0ABM5MQH9_RICCA|nr:hypothetical protein RCA_00065 [Rickettsia canadensis str. CA410]